MLPPSGERRPGKLRGSDDGRRGRLAGRRPATAGLGLESAGITPDGRGAVPVDDHCQAAGGLWALGDVTGTALFTHVAKYQGRIVADNILGRGRAASYHGIPRVIFADPEMAATGPPPARPATTASMW